MVSEYVSHIVDAGHIRNIGEQSISNKIQAIVELVKNAYDSDALTCIVRFYGEMIKGDIKITNIEIEDSGIGMTKNDIKNKLMTVGTPNKIKDTYSPKFERRVSGAKGMGHYSMQRLGTKTKITTTPELYDGREFHDHDNSTYILKINWDEYIPGKNFQDISHELLTKEQIDRCGTKIEISGLKDSWNVKGKNNDLKKLSKIMGNIMLPKKLQKGKKDEFVATIETIGFMYDLPEPHGNLLDSSLYRVDSFLRGNQITFKIYQRKKNKYQLIHSDKIKTDAQCGDANFTLDWFYNKKEKWWDGIFYSAHLKRQLEENHGIKIYNDNIRVMPYGEVGNDWLGLDARRAKRGGGKIRNSTVIGTVDLSRSKNPQIIETTSREAITENAEFRSLKNKFLMEVIGEFETAVEEIIKEEEYQETQSNPANIAKLEIDRIQTMIGDYDTIKLEEKHEINSKLLMVSQQIQIQQQQNQKTEEELTANIEMYRNLATVGIQTIAFNHEIINPIRFIKATLTNLDSSYKDLTDDEKKTFITKSLERIIYTLNWANRIKEFSSILAGADNIKQKRSTINIDNTLFDLKNSLSLVLEQLHIVMDDPIIIGDVPRIKMNVASFESIFINLISNSVRALKKVRRPRIINIKIYADSTDIIFEFEDNGCGISDDNKNRIFRPFFTTYKNPDDRGTGMGLTIVKDIVEIDYNGSIELDKTVDESKHSGKGMTKFIVRLPLKEVKTT